MTEGNALFEKAPVPKAFFTLTLPVVLGRIVGLVYNIVDTWFIARTLDMDLVAGVSLCAPIFILTIALGDLFGLGSSSVISRLFGQHRDDEARRVSSFSFWGAVAAGTALGVLMLVLRGPVLRLMGAREGIFVHASQYYTWLAAGAPILVAQMVPTNQLRSEGLAREAMIASIAGSAVNIILDPLFIFTLGMGAAGAAAATVLGNAVSFGYMVWVTAKKAQKLSVSPKLAHVDRASLGAILAIGVPASVSNLMNSLGGALLNRSLVDFGDDKLAAMGIVSKIYLVMTMLMVSFAFGAMPLVGYNVGSGDRERLGRVIRFDLLVQMAVSVVGAGAIALSAPLLIRAFVDDPVLISTGSVMLRCMLLSAPFVGVFLVISTLFQSAGKGLHTLVLTLSRQGILFAACLFLLRGIFGYPGVLCAQAVSDILTTLLALGLLKTSGLGLLNK